jgi:hypothetical protein
MDADPLSHQPNRSSRDLSIKNGSVESYPSYLPAVPGVKVRWVVIAEEHQNRDSVEGTDPGHGMYRCDVTRLAARLAPEGSRIARQARARTVSRFALRRE